MTMSHAEICPLSENYHRGVAERKAWLAERPEKTWADATAAYSAKRLAETHQTTASSQRLEELLATIRSTSAAPRPVAEAATARTPVHETAANEPAGAPAEPPAPLHKLSDADFAQHANQHWEGIFQRLQDSRTVTAAPFWTEWSTR